MTRAQTTSTTQQNTAGPIPPNPAGKNVLLNSSFDIWQRGTSIARTGSGGTSSDYTADRWVIGGSGGTSTTTSRQSTNDSTNLPHIQYCARVQRTASNSDTSTIYFAQVFESINSIPLAGKTVTLSFYARKGADYSASGSGLGASFGGGTGTDQSLFAFTGATTAIGFTPTLTTTWQRFSATGTVSSTATQLRLYFSFSPTGTAGANDYFEITGVQIEVSSSATPFNRNSGTIQGELAACQRYYYKETPDNQYAGFGIGILYSTTAGYVLWRLPVQMRTQPTLSVSSTASHYQTYTGGAGGLATCSAAPSSQGFSKIGCFVYFAFTSPGAGNAAGQAFQGTSDSTFNGYLAASAEL